jgi:type IV pilus assembly protein PilV
MAKHENKIGRRSKGNNHGFTLLEVLVTLVILSVGLLGTLGLTTGVIRGNFFSKNLTSATAVAQTQLEAAQREGYANVTTTKFPATVEVVSMGGVNFNRTTTISNDTPAANMKTVSVTVNWYEANNTQRTITLQTILAQ